MILKNKFLAEISFKPFTYVLQGLGTIFPLHDSLTQSQSQRPVWDLPD